MVSDIATDACLEQGLVGLSELGNIRDQGRVYSVIHGRYTFSRGWSRTEAIELFQKSYRISEETMTQKDRARYYCRLGIAFRTIEAWDYAITALEKRISMSASIELDVRRNELQCETYRVLGQTYLEHYYCYASLLGVSETREEVIRKASLCSQEAINLRREDNPSIYLDLAQANYFLGDRECPGYAQGIHGQNLETRTITLPTCHQTCPKDAHMEKCSVCKVARYCNRAHSIRT